MESKRMGIYFEKAKSLPIAMSVAEVSQLISAKGVTSPPKKSWWNLNNFIIMTASILLISAALLTFQPLPFNGEEKAYEPSVLLPSFAQWSDYQLEPVNGVYSKMKLHNSPQALPLPIKSEEEQDSNKSQAVSPLGSVTAIPLIAEIEPLAPVEPIAPAVEVEEPEVSNLGGDFEGKSKTITKEFDIVGITTLDISHRNGDVNIETWDQEKIEVRATFTVKTENPEHEVLALNDFDISLNPIGTKAVVESSWDELNNCACTSSRTTAPKKGLLKFLYFSSDNQTNKAKTNSGEEFEYENFKIVYTIKIPKKLNVDVSNKYANVTVQEIDGNLDATLFRGNIVAHNIGGNADVTVKYGGAILGDFEKAAIELFRSTLVLGSGNTLDVKANYSEVELVGAKFLIVEAFRSNLVSNESIQKLEGSVKYGDLTVKGPSESGELDLFRSNLKGETFKSLILNTSYSSLTAKKIGTLDFKKAFRTTIEVGEVDELRGDLQYSPVTIQTLNQKMDLKTFRGKLEIELVEANFLSIQVHAEYTNIDLIFSPKSKYNLDATTSYTEFKGPKEIMDANQNKETNSITNQIVGTFNSSKQRQASTVQVKAFQGHLTLN